MIRLGSHVSMSAPDYVLGSVNEAIEYKANALMLYTGAPQNSFRAPINKLKTAEAKEKWGNTNEYKEYEEKSKNRTKQEFEDINDRFMNIFSEIGKLKDLSVEDEKVQGKIKELQQFISDNYYTCTNEILYSLGQMYVNDERFKKNIDNAGGEGTAKFVYEAISVYCSK